MVGHTRTEKIGGDSIYFCGHPSRARNRYNKIDQKREKDLLRVEGRLDAALEDVDTRLDATLVEIKTLINGMTMQINGITLQQNELRSQMMHRDRGSNGELILG